MINKSTSLLLSHGTTAVLYCCIISWLIRSIASGKTEWILGDSSSKCEHVAVVDNVITGVLVINYGHGHYTVIIIILTSTYFSFEHHFCTFFLGQQEMELLNCIIYDLFCEASPAIVL